MKATLAFVLLATPCAAELPPLACDRVTEQGMEVSRVGPFGDGGGPVPVVVEDYRNAYNDIDGLRVYDPAPVAALEYFDGTRITDCRTGDFIAIRSVSTNDVWQTLSATEFLREPLRANQPIPFLAFRQAAQAVYGDVIELRETEQTCGCAYLFNEARPASQTPFSGRIFW